MSVKIRKNPNANKKILIQNEKILHLFADLLAGRIDPQTPFKTGALSMSAFQAGRRIEQSKDTKMMKHIAYAAPYASKVYYGTHLKFTRDKHFQAQAFWGRGLMNNPGELEKVLSATTRHIKKL